MKTNVSIELTEAERSALANIIDLKETKRLATRAEVVDLCQRHIGGLLGEGEAFPDNADALARSHATVADLYRVDPEDAAILAGKPLGYIRGWNLVKRRRAVA